MVYPDLFKLCLEKEITVSRMKANPQSVTFSRWLIEGWRDDWEQILLQVDSIQLREGEDTITWKIGPHGRFTVKSVYNALTSNESGPYRPISQEGVEVQNT